MGYIFNEMTLSEISLAMQLWQLHVAEQMILDDDEANPDKYKDKKHVEAMMNDVVDDEHSVEYTKAYFKKTLLPKMILVGKT